MRSKFDGREDCFKNCFIIFFELYWEVIGNFEKVVYDDNLSKACEIRCPLKIKMHEAVILARKILVQEKKDPVENKQMIKNLRETGNIYGIKEEESD